MKEKHRGTGQRAWLLERHHYSNLTSGKPFMSHTLTSVDLSVLAGLINLVELNCKGCKLMTGRSAWRCVWGVVVGWVSICELVVTSVHSAGNLLFFSHGQRILDALVRFAIGLSASQSDIIPTLMPKSHPHPTPPYPNSLAHT